MANTGKYNRRITIVTPGTMTPTTLGGFTEGTPTTRQAWCNARQLSMQESLLYGLETANATYRFRFRYYSADDITFKHELIFESRNFRIVSVENVDEEKKEITVIATEKK